MANHETLQAEAQNKAEKFAREGAREMENLKNKTKNAWDDASEKAKNAWDEVSDQVEKKTADARKAVNGYVKENPIAALGWAALAGAAIALLLRR